ncbi:MAG: C2 family cysteine protease [Elusimicrobiota bacterium]
MLVLTLLAVLAQAPGPRAFGAEPLLPTALDVQDLPFPPLHYALFSGQPFDGTMPWDQVIQGRLGSCFFLSTLAAVAKTHPAFVARAIRREDDGTYAVAFSSANGRRVVVRVNGRLPVTAAGELYFARGRDARELRPALFEKAYAELSGGYERINGGEPADAFQALTGAAGRKHELSTRSEDEIWTLLGRAEKARRPVVASTPDYEELRRAAGRDDLAGLIDDHTYVLLLRREKAGERRVRVYTPLSPGDAGYAKDGPRLLELSLREFKKDFESITIGDVRE